MVIKKTNSIFNSGATQRVTNGRAVSGMRYEFQANDIALHVTKRGDNNGERRASPKGGKSQRSSPPSRHVDETLDFLADHLGWGELRDADCRGVFERPWPFRGYTQDRYDLVIRFNANKGKRWNLLGKLPEAAHIFNFLAGRVDWYRFKTRNSTQAITTELWDFIVSRVFFTKAIPSLFQSRLVSDVDDNVRYYGSRRIKHPIPKYKWDYLVKFGLMDIFQKVDFSVSVNQDSFNSRPRTESFTTLPVCQTVESDEEENDEQGISKLRKKRKCQHARGIQRPSSWKLSSPSKRRRRHDFDARGENTDSSSMKHRKPSSGYSPSGQEACTAEIPPKDRVHVSITKSPRADARAFNLNFVVKKYGHLPYNAPRVAICKSKSRPSGRLGIHKAFTYARLKQEIALAVEEISESVNARNNAPDTADNAWCDDVCGDKACLRHGVCRDHVYSCDNACLGDNVCCDHVYCCDNACLRDKVCSDHEYGRDSEIDEELDGDSKTYETDDYSQTTKMGAFTLNDFISQRKPLRPKKKRKKLRGQHDIPTAIPNVDQNFSFIELPRSPTFDDSGHDSFPLYVTKDEEFDWIIVSND